MAKMKKKGMRMSGNILTGGHKNLRKHVGRVHMLGKRHSKVHANKG